MNQEEFKRKLTAILSADVEGYSRLMGEDEDGTIRTLTTYRELMSTLIQKHRGRVVDSPGDNLLAEFGSVVDAVRCAVEIQEELRVRNAELPENRRMEFRIGINLGDVVEEGERIYGDGVNITARVEGLADGGGICISGTVYDSIKNKLSLSYESMGEHTVKNISEPVRVYRMRIGPEAAVPMEREEKKKPRRWRWAAIGGGAVLIIIAGGLAIWNYYFRPMVEPASVEKMLFPLTDRPSIAVLPFTNMTGDPEQEYIGDGISVNIITALSKVSNMFVIDRNSTFTYKGKAVKIKQVAEELSVQYVLEGSVQKSGDRLRVTAQLIDALSGHHLWSDKYDREMRELFDLQDEITKKIVVSLDVEFGQYERARIYAKSTNNLEAWSYVIKGFNLVFKGNKQDMAKGRELFEKAIRLDPEYSMAWAWLSRIHVAEVRLGWSESPVDSRKRSKECLQKALALDDENSLAHAFLGLSYLGKGQHDKAIAEGERAISLDPNSTGGLAVFSFILHHSGRFEEAIEQMKKAMRLGARYPPGYLFKFAFNYAFLGRYDEAIAILNQLDERFRKGEFPIRAIWWAHTGLAVVYVELGRVEEARALVAEARKANPDVSLERFKRPPYKDPVYLQRLIENLRKAGLSEKTQLPLPDKPSIAVLPFVNMSGDPEQEFLSDGITESIITALSNDPELFVIARNSTFSYKGKQVMVQQVSRELGVRYVLEGSVQKSGEQVRITAQLVDAVTGRHLWAEQYDRDLKDLFALQDEITLNILTELGVKLTIGEQARTRTSGTNNLKAYLKYLKAREYFLRYNRDNNVMARQVLKEVIALDPDYPNAHSFLGWTYVLDIFFDPTKSPGKSIRQAAELAQKALALDDSLPITIDLLGYIYLLKRQHEKAIAEYERAIAINPNVAFAHAHLGLALIYVSRPEEAIASFKKAMRLNPIPPSFYLHTLANAYRVVGQYEDAIAAAKKVLDRTPDNLWANVYLTATYSEAGRLDEARAQAAEVLRVQPKFSAEGIVKKMPFKYKAEADRLVAALRKAGLK